MSDISVAKQEEGQRALSREWLVARIVVGAGFVAAIAAIVWFGWVQPEMLRREAVARLQKHKQETAVAAAQLCRTGLAAAQNFGIVPTYGHLSGSKVYITNVQGPYICIAATPSTKYLVTVEVLCRNLKDRRCVSLYGVIQGDGTILYKRQS
jgi:hypothetical protein